MSTTLDEMRAEITRLVGGDRVVITGGGLHGREVAVFNQRERLRRFSGLAGTPKAALAEVLRFVRGELRP